MSNNSSEWDLSSIDDLLQPAPLRLETGIARLPNGCLVVAVRTDLHGCKGRMLDWWFKFFETTQHIKWWHPHDHVAHHGWDSKWKKGENYIGASIRAVESLAEIPPVAAQLKFHDPKDVFDAAKLARAFEQQETSAAIYARIGFGAHIAIDANGDPEDGQMIHQTRDTPFGCVLRSRFLLGQSSDKPERDVPDQLGLALMRHCYTEFTYLSRFLPSLYYGEHANDEPAPLPW
ncbi:DAPG hydrolase family protein [Janthinobacterium fluminis]|uniref:Hydrolase n=1 Tax=Janthinobacterium fluminis TaxID=2987524 RepID=A0ABT5JZ44_9BURK|nr:hydrolase [Janthinobacterium fluminis]MDC8757316.1 hydrolase [Janthinobacterium fluminis]